MAALMVRVVIAPVFGMVSGGRHLAHQIAVVSMMVDCRAADVRDGLDCPHQEQDSGQNKQEPMRRTSFYRADCRAFHP